MGGMGEEGFGTIENDRAVSEIGLSLLALRG